MYTGTFCQNKINNKKTFRVEIRQSPVSFFYCLSMVSFNEYIAIDVDSAGLKQDWLSSAFRWIKQ